jgi:hypothetical protein
MICARCNKLILKDEAYRTVVMDRPTGPPAASVVVHTKLCRRAPQQTYPTRRFGV